MAENTEKKLLIEVEVIENFLNAKANVEKWKKELKEAQQSEKATKEEINDIAKNLAVATNEYKLANKQISSFVQIDKLLAGVQGEVNKSLGEMQAELKALRNIPLENLDPVMIEKVSISMAELTEKINEYKINIKGLETKKFFANIAEGAEFAIAGASALSNTLKTFGVDAEILGGLEDKTTELIAAVQAMGVVSEYLADKKYKIVAANIAQINSNIKNAASSLFSAGATTTEAVAEEGATVAKTGGTIATTLLTAATWLLNAALGVLLAPITLVIAAIAALIAGIYFLVKAFDSSADAQEKAEKAQAAYERQAQKTQNTIDQIEAKRTKQMNDADLRGRQEILNLKRNGATKEQIAQKEYETETKKRDISIKASANIVKAKLNEIRASDANLIAQKALLRTLSEGSDKYKDQIKVIKDLIDAKKKAAKIHNEEKANVEKGNMEQKEADQKRKEEHIAAVKEAAEKAKEIRAKNAKAEVDIENTKSQKIIDKANEVLENDKKNASQKYEAIATSEAEQIKIIERNRDNEIKFGKLTADQRTATIAKAAYEIEKIKQDSEKKITDIEEKELAKRFKALETDLSNRKNKYSEAMDDELIVAALKYVNGKLSAEEYEKEKQKISEKYREIDFNETLKALQKEAELYTTDKDKKAEIEKAIADAKAKYAKESTDFAIKQKEKEGEANEKAKDKELKTEEEKAQLRKEIIQKAYQDIQGIVNSFYESKIQQYENESTAVSDESDKQIAAIEAKEKSGVISSKSAEKQKAAIQADAQKKEAEIDKKKLKAKQDQAKFNKATSIFNIAISTAEGIAATTKMGMPYAIPFIIMEAAIGALQTAAVLAQPLPKAGKGKLLVGPSHASGGIPIEAEGGEAIINKRSTAMFRPLLSAINEAGGGIKFASGGVAGNYTFNDGGYAVRESGKNNITADDIKRAMKEAVSEVKVITTVEDIRKADANYTRIQDRANY